jgi:WD40 repeat protein
MKVTRATMYQVLLTCALGATIAFAPLKALCGDLYVVNPAGTIQRHDENTGALVQTITAGIDLNIPNALAFGSDGNLYVTGGGYSSNVRRFTPDGTDLGDFAHVEIPMDLAFDSMGNLYVLSWGSGSVRKFSPSGASLGNFVTDLTAFSALAIDADDNLYVSSVQEIRKYAPNGQQLLSFGNFPIHSIDVGPDNHVYAVEGSNIRRFSSSGDQSPDFLISDFLIPRGMAWNSSGELFVSSVHDNEADVYRIPSNGGPPIVFANGGVSTPMSIAFAPDSVPEPQLGVYLLTILGVSSRRRVASGAR